MDPLPAIVILVPILLPVARQLSIGPVHFGIILIASLGIGFVTPPVGNVLFVACSIGQVSIASVLLYLLPFIGVMILALGVITFVPEISLILPRLLGYL